MNHTNGHTGNEWVSYTNNRQTAELLPQVGEVWLTRVGPYRVRIILDCAKGKYPLVGLIEMTASDSEIAWNFSREGGTRDPYDNGFDLVRRDG